MTDSVLENRGYRPRGDARDGASTEPSRGFVQWLEAVDSGDDAASEARLGGLEARDLPHIDRVYRDARAAVHAQDAPGFRMAQPEIDDPAHENRRWWAVRALAERAPVRYCSTLALALDDPTADVRAAATLCAVTAIEQAWGQDRVCAEKLLEGLVGCLEDSQGLVRHAAADALAQLGNLALPVLWRTLKEGEQGGRTRAAYALRRMKSLDAAHYLYQMLEDANPMVSLYAREGLDDLGLLTMTYYKA